MRLERYLTKNLDDMLSTGRSFFVLGHTLNDDLVLAVEHLERKLFRCEPMPIMIKLDTDLFINI